MVDTIFIGIAGGGTTYRGRDLSFCISPCFLFVLGRGGNVVLFDVGSQIGQKSRFGRICRCYDTYDCNIVVWCGN